MDDLKSYSNETDVLDSLIQTVKHLARILEYNLGSRNKPWWWWKKGQEITDSIEMPDGEFIKLMDEVRATNI